MKPDERSGGIWAWAFGLIPVVWLALLVAPAVSGGIPAIIEYFPAAMSAPFHIEWCEDSVKTVLLFIAAYGIGVGIYLSTRRNYRRGEEHGSAKWGDPRAVNKKYRDKDQFQNRIFTQHVRMGLDGRKHRRTLNTLVCGGSGAGKSRFYGKLKVRRSVAKRKGGGLNIGETKTETGTRTIVLPPSTAELLRKRKETAVSEWIFPNIYEPEKPMHPDYAYHRLKTLLKQAELPLIRFHDLRHTFATHALAGGVDAKTLSGILGHTNASFTLDTYTHVTTDMQRNASTIVGSFMDEILLEGDDTNR